MTFPATMFSFISSGDQRLMRRVNRWKPPRWIRLWMILATRAGDGWLWYALGTLVLLFGGPSRFAAVTAAGVSCGLGTVLFLALKRLTGRKRPCAVATHCWATLLPPDQFSFPSGHSISAFAFAVSIGMFEPSLLYGLLFCALSVAISRVILGLHFLSDVVVGSLIGAGLGYAAYHLLVYGLH
jgi:undecaprenyl-diphosphatase